MGDGRRKRTAPHPTGHRYGLPESNCDIYISDVRFCRGDRPVAPTDTMRRSAARPPIQRRSFAFQLSPVRRRGGGFSAPIRPALWFRIAPMGRRATTLVISGEVIRGKAAPRRLSGAVLFGPFSLATECVKSNYRLYISLIVLTVMKSSWVSHLKGGIKWISFAVNQEIKPRCFPSV